MQSLLASTLVAGLCSALIGIESAVSSALHTTGGGATTAITIGAALLGVWAVAVLREE